MKLVTSQLMRSIDQATIENKGIPGPELMENAGRGIAERIRKIILTENPDCKVVVANRKAGGIGINLVEASYSIVYSRNFDLNDELQSEARNHRKGSEMHEKITKVDYVSKDTVDEACLKALRNKEKIGSRVVDMVKGE